MDIDIRTLNYDLDALKGAVNDKTSAIMVVNILGNPNNFSEINRIIDNRKIVIIEDNYRSMGAF